MKKTLIFILVMALALLSVSPALAGNGNGGGRGNGSGGNGNSSGQHGLNSSSNKLGKKASSVFTGVIVAIDGTAEASVISITVYGGKDTSLYGTDVEVQTDSSTRFLLKDVGTITFDDIVVGDTASVAVGSDGIADRITVGVVCPNIP